MKSLQTPRHVARYEDMSPEELDLLLADEEGQQVDEDEQPIEDLVQALTVEANVTDHVMTPVMDQPVQDDASPTSMSTNEPITIVSSEDPPALHPVNFIWADDPQIVQAQSDSQEKDNQCSEVIHITKVIDLELDWEIERRGLLKTIEELTNFRNGVLQAIHVHISSSTHLQEDGSHAVEGQLVPVQGHPVHERADGHIAGDGQAVQRKDKKKPRSISRTTTGARDSTNGEPRDHTGVRDSRKPRDHTSVRDSREPRDHTGVRNSRDTQRPTDSKDTQRSRNTSIRDRSMVGHSGACPPAKQRRLNHEDIRRHSSLVTELPRCNELRSIHRPYSRAESSAYITGISVMLIQTKDLLCKFNPEIVESLRCGSDQTNFFTLQQVTKHLNKVRTESQLFEFLTNTDLLHAPNNYENSEQLPPLPNLFPGNRSSMMNIHNVTHNAKQNSYLRNRLIKLLISVIHPKLASAIMSLQGDRMSAELLKTLFAKQANIHLQIHHFYLLLIVTSCYDVTRGRTFYANKDSELYLPSNIQSPQFEQRLFQSRDMAWSRADFRKYFHSENVQKPMQSLDNLHLCELVYIREILSRK